MPRVLRLEEVLGRHLRADRQSQHYGDDVHEGRSAMVSREAIYHAALLAEVAENISAPTRGVAVGRRRTQNHVTRSGNMIFYELPDVPKLLHLDLALFLGGQGARMMGGWMIGTRAM